MNGRRRRRRRRCSRRYTTGTSAATTMAGRGRSGRARGVAARPTATIQRHPVRRGAAQEVPGVGYCLAPTPAHQMAVSWVTWGRLTAGAARTEARARTATQHHLRRARHGHPHGGAVAAVGVDAELRGRRAREDRGPAVIGGGSGHRGRGRADRGATTRHSLGVGAPELHRASSLGPALLPAHWQRLPRVAQHRLDAAGGPDQQRVIPPHLLGARRWPRPLRLNISDKNRRYISKSQSKRPPKNTQRPPHHRFAETPGRPSK
jgi:hypothetical protein